MCAKHDASLVPQRPRPRKRFGQHFLSDPRVIRRILAAVRPGPGDHIVEIGAGRGALSKPLLRSAARLDLIELDRDLIEPLRKACQGWNDVGLHNADARTFDFCRLLRTPSERLRVLGNLPYNVATPILFHLLEQVHCIGEMWLMLQREVAERLTAPPGTASYGRLSVMVQLRCQTESVFDVPPEAFRPQPKVHSTLVHLLPHARTPVVIKDERVFAEVVAAGFSQRRKTLRNALRGLLDGDEIRSAAITPGSRAQTLTLADFARLAAAVIGKRSRSGSPHAVARRDPGESA